MDFVNLTVGERLDHDMPDECMSVVLIHGAPMLTFNFAVSERDIAAFRRGSCSFGLFSKSNVLFFLFKIDGFLDWSDLAFTIHLAQDETIENHGGYLPFHLVLVDSSTSIIKAMRIVTVSPAFRSILCGIIRQQAGERFDTIGYYKKIQNIYAAHPKAETMLKEAVIVENGGRTITR